MSTRSRSSGPGPASLAESYRPLPGVTDEMVAADGSIRPHWLPFLEALAKLGPGGIARRFASADKYLRDSGVYYRVYADGAGGSERPWPLSHVPLIIDPAEWDHLERGLIQRAELLEAIMADSYGENRLVAEGALPAAVVAGSSEYLRPLAGAPPRGGSHLWMYAADIGRGPDGRFWVLSDRTQAPSGPGYALENRIALSRALPDTYRDFNVRRLAGFFDGFRSALAGLARREDGRPALLTPGPLNETYFEHAYLARYLGFLLVQAEDLAVRGDEVFVRTVSGLRRVEVLLRRLDSDFADPLELNSKSRIGVPGLVRAVRAQRVAVANALGSGMLESRALMSFMPTLARRILGEDLLLPNVATWWCGQNDEREYVLERLDELVVASAFREPVAGLPADAAVFGSSLDERQRMRLEQAMARRGIDIVGQEPARLSTTPVWVNGRLEPRPFILRCYVARTSDGWAVMPGGFCRVSDKEDAYAVSMQTGGRSADVWVTSVQPVAPISLLPTPEDIPIRRTTGMLPSRAADNMFWLGRYTERSEATLRVVRALASQMAETGRRQDPVSLRLTDMLRAWGAAPAREVGEVDPGPLAAVLAAVTDDTLPGSVPALVARALQAASVTRDRLSTDMWRALSELDDLAGAQSSIVSEMDVIEFAQRALRILAALAGFVHENMTRLFAWRFLEMGRRIERALALCRFTRRFAFDTSWQEGLDALLELADSQITYRNRYVIRAVAPALDLILLDENNPRSVAFQMGRIGLSLAELPGHERGGPLNDAERIVARLRTDLQVADPRNIRATDLLATERRLMDLSGILSERYFMPRETSASGEELV